MLPAAVEAQISEDQNSSTLQQAVSCLRKSLVPIGHQRDYDKAHGIPPSTKETELPIMPAPRVNAIGEAFNAEKEQLRAEFDAAGLAE